MMSKARLALFATIGGALTGLISYAFLRSLDWATNTRIAHGWLVWLLPAVGLLVGAAYHYLGGRAKGGTPAVIEQGHLFTHGVPARMAPMIFGGSVVGHLAGASVGREGAALQMAGSVTDSAARLARLPADQRRLLIAASLAGGWGAVFGVPFTGIAFMLQVTRRHRWQALLPAACSAFAGKVVVDALGYRMTNRPHPPTSTPRPLRPTTSTAPPPSGRPPSRKATRSGSRPGTPPPTNRPPPTPGRQQRRAEGPTTCVPTGDVCTTNTDCCSTQCVGGHCTLPCELGGSACAANGDCCSGQCIGNACVDIPQ